ncbi:unnamed protein product, partial [Urochloa humidicola]
LASSQIPIDGGGSPDDGSSRVSSVEAANQATSPWSLHGSGREGMGTGARLSSHSHSPLALRPGSSVQPRVSMMLLWRRQRRQINREQSMANPAAPGGMSLFLQAVVHYQRGGADATAHRPNGRPGLNCFFLTGSARIILTRK